MLSIQQLRKTYGVNEVLKGIDLSVASGEIVNLIGFSGCGKSTLLKIIAGLENYQSGSFSIDQGQVGMCFQYSALFDSMTIAENIAFPLKVKKKETKPDVLRKLVREKLDLVGLHDIEDQYPSELSGGMKKRVSFARAIIDNPNTILYDEPTAGLDPVASTIIEDLIVKLGKEVNATSIVVTHQPSTIQRTADRVALLYEGKVAWTGRADELYDPNNTNEFARQFREGSVEGPMAIKH